MLQRIKFVVEQHSDGFVAYPLGIEGSVVGQGDTAETALADAQSALRAHMETFGPAVFEESPLLDAFLVEETVTAL